MGWSAFAPKGLTAVVPVTTTSSTPIQAPAYPGEPGCVNYLVSNATTQACFLAIGANAGLVAAIPVAGTPANGFWIPANSTQSYTFGTNTFFAAIAAATTTTLYITPGDGL